MSIGNLKDYGNKGNNFPWQLKMLEGLQAILNAFTGVTTGAVRYPIIITEFGPGSVPNNVYSFSISNVGSASGTVDGQILPAGTTINYNAELNNTLNGLSYDATGTTFLITWIA
jgi:glutamine cyclotransferase